ncbi:MAG: hypothetical protein HYV65_03555 [Candidatus Spechtbacteria bacterium]|nr:hypothetical protein [Candidatus Spechtbacteria bacterium]
MSLFFKFALIDHVLYGLLAIACFYVAWLWVLKQKPPVSSLRKVTFAGFILFVLSWLAGGDYYLHYYGQFVKPVIKAGQYSWAHTVGMETKEHIFLFLPFLALSVFATIWFAGERLETNPALKRALTYVTGLVMVLGTAIAVIGMIISGAVR